MMRLSFATALGTGRLPLNRATGELARDEGGPVPDPAVQRSDLRMPTPDVAPLDPALLAENLHELLSPHTEETLEATPVQLRAPLILGSPEFMMR